jgi:hypothetical protein
MNWWMIVLVVLVVGLFAAWAFGGAVKNGKGHRDDYQGGRS